MTYLVPVQDSYRKRTPVDHPIPIFLWRILLPLENRKIYWDCQKCRHGQCKGRAVTTYNGDAIVVLKGLFTNPKSDNDHPPNREEGETEIVCDRLKRLAGLQKAYNNPDNHDTKLYTHMLLVLAYVPAEDVEDAFALLETEILEELQTILTYFKETYVSGRRGRGRRRVLPRYPISTTCLAHNIAI